MAKSVEKTANGMNIIDNHIETGNFSNIYLLFGEQRYLVNQYVKKLSGNLTDTSDNSMNYIRLKKDNVKYSEIADYALDMPFFADRKVIEVWNSGFFKNSNETLEKNMQQLIEQLPESNVIIFVEEAVDKRLKIYNAIKKAGTIAEFSTPDERTLLIWIKRNFTTEGYEVEDNACYRLLDAVGTDMTRISSEIEKIKGYCAHGIKVTAEIVDRLCVSQVEGKVFEMIEALSRGDKATTARLYDDLLYLKEPVMRILALINRQYEKLLRIRLAMDEGVDKMKMAEFSGLQTYFLGKYMAQAKGYTRQELMNCLTMCQKCDIDIKTGRVRDARALELLVFNLVARVNI